MNWVKVITLFCIALSARRIMNVILSRAKSLTNLVVKELSQISNAILSSTLCLSNKAWNPSRYCPEGFHVILTGKASMCLTFSVLNSPMSAAYLSSCSLNSSWMQTMKRKASMSTNEWYLTSLGAFLFQTSLGPFMHSFPSSWWKQLLVKLDFLHYRNLSDLISCIDSSENETRAIKI